MRLMSVIYKKHQQGQNCDWPLVCVLMWESDVTFKATELSPGAFFLILFQHLVQELPHEKIYSLSRHINIKKLFQGLENLPATFIAQLHFDNNRNIIIEELGIEEYRNRIIIEEIIGGKLHYTRNKHRSYCTLREGGSCPAHRNMEL